ncbi:MAG: histidine kinase [Actinomycetota bacterium]|nr:histidine kinase [Actinomycetota bacterium]
MSTQKTNALLFAGVLALAVVEPSFAAGLNANDRDVLVAQASTSTAPQGVKTSLGDLSSFRLIAADTLKIVHTGDFDAAKKRIKDLELSWDQAEPKMKPMAPDKWQTVDVAIDRALKEVRAWRATPASSAEALNALIATLDTLK